jgi:hypothetical protein
VGRCSVEHKIPQLSAQWRFVSEEAGDHCAEEPLWIEPGELEGMASLCREQRGEGQLRSSIAFPERVDRIQVGKERGGFLGKSFRLPSSQEVGATETGEKPSHLASDIFRETEGAAILGHPNGSVASSPTVDVLEEMPMHSTVVRGREAAGGKWLFSPHSDAERLEGAELGRVAQAQLVLQHSRAGVAVPVRLSVVKVDAQIFFSN